MINLLTAFNAGEVSPLLVGRTDLPQMARACRIMRGFIPGIAGGAFRRPPLLHVGMAGSTGGRLLPFNAAAGASYQIELRDASITIWNADASSAAGIVTPWAAADLDGIQTAQSNDVMWMVHASHPPQELSRLPATWTFEEIPWKYPPLRDENLTAVTITPAAIGAGTLLAGQTVNLTASGDIFHPNHTGAFWEISHFRETQTTELEVAIIPPAAAEFLFTATPTAGQTMTVGGSVYTWRAAAGDLAGAGDVLIDAAEGSRDNIIAAINADTAEAAKYGIGTARNALAEAVDGGKVTTDTAATGRLVFSGTNNDLTDGSNTVWTVGSVSYRIEANTLGAGDIKKGATLQDTLSNLVKAITLTGTAGVHYHASFAAANPDAAAAVDGTNAINFTARVKGPSGNSVVTTVANGGKCSFGASTLTGGVTGGAYKLRVNARKPGEEGNAIAVSDTMDTDAWNTATLTGGADIGSEAAPVTSEEVKIRGQYDFTTYGRWSGTVYVEQKNAAGLWDVLHRVTGRFDANKTIAGVAEGEQTMRIRVVGMSGRESSDFPIPRFVLEAAQSLVHGLVRITSVSSPTQATAEVFYDLHSAAATPNWREGAFSRYRGFPSVVALHEQRLIFSGHPGEPQKIWASGTGDFRNFEETGFDDGSWQYQPATQEGNAIRWVVSQTGLIIGTAGDEWLMDGGEDTGITPTNVQAKRQSAYGSDSVTPILAGSVVLFVQRGGLAVREYVFDYQNAGYIAPELTELVEHLTRRGVRALALQRLPWPVVWAVTHDGNLLACTYARHAQVIGWAPQPVDGLVESVSVTYGQRGLADEVWIIVNRNGSRRVERFDPEHWQRLHDGGVLFHMDAARTGTTGHTHLAGQLVRVMSDGVEQDPQYVSASGAVTAAGSVIVGLLPPESQLQPMIFDIPTQTGSSISKKYHVPELAVRFYQTRAAQYADKPGALKFEVPFRDTADDASAPPVLFTGQKSVSCQANFNEAVDAVIYSSGIHPVNVLTLAPKLQIYGT